MDHATKGYNKTTTVKNTALDNLYFMREPTYITTPTTKAQHTT